MGIYILKRILLLIPVVLGVLILVFTLLYFAPGDAASVILGSNYTEQAAAALRHSLGLDRPYLVQLGKYMYNVFVKLDFGNSWVSGDPVSAALAVRFPLTVILGVASIVVTGIVGVWLGVVAAVNQNKWQDYSSMVVALLGASLPAFFFALVLVLFFAFKLPIFPAYGMGGFKYWVLPVIANSFTGMAMLARQTRSSMLEVINSDYITMAKAKGLNKRSIIYRHALPNALIPIITTIGLIFGGVIGGAIIIETVFSIPGVGYYLVTGSNNRDYNIVLACTLVISVTFAIIMLIADIAMAAVDPRIKAQFAGVKRRRRE